MSFRKNSPRPETLTQRGDKNEKTAIHSISEKDYPVYRFVLRFGDPCHTP
jgi:hypothetical protein